MKKAISLFFYLFSLFACSAQNDTSKIYNSSQVKRGFYLNYVEYLNNAPSLTPDFTTVLLFIKVKTDTLVTGARYNTPEKLPAVWGFSDGTDVFIRKRISQFKKRFLKAQYIGKNPFFLFWHKDVYAIETPLLETAAAPATAPARYDLMFINFAGKAKIASYKNLKRLFAAAPDLLRRFKTERAFTNKIKTEYLVEFNEKYISSGNAAGPPGGAR